MPGAWVAMITNTMYLPGCLVLAHSLRAVDSKYPLIVMLCDIPDEAKELLTMAGVQVMDVGKLVPTDSEHVCEKRVSTPGPS